MLAWLEPAPSRAAEPHAWEFTAALNTYLFPHDEASVLPVGTADRGALHLEGRYNYEAERTGSFFGGRTFTAHGAIEAAVTPMLGLVLGETDGAAPGLEVDLAWRRLDLYSEAEYVISFDDSSDDFFYAWSEAAAGPTEWLRAGLVAQRTKLVDTPREIEWGFLVGGAVGPYGATLHMFNPDAEESRYYVVSVEASF